MPVFRFENAYLKTFFCRIYQGFMETKHHSPGDAATLEMTSLTEDDPEQPLSPMHEASNGSNDQTTL